MGWGSGTNIAEGLEPILVKYVPKKDLLKVAREVLELLTDQDWDCIDEVDLFNLVDCIDNFDEYSEYDDEEGELKNKIEKLKKKFGL